MGIALDKKNQSFRLPVGLIERLRLLAKRQNRSLNNYVETLLLDAVYYESNNETHAVKQKAYGTSLQDSSPPLDLSAVEANGRYMDL